MCFVARVDCRGWPQSPQIAGKVPCAVSLMVVPWVARGAGKVLHGSGAWGGLGCRRRPRVIRSEVSSLDRIVLWPRSLGRDRCRFEKCRSQANVENLERAKVEVEDHKRT